MIKELEKNVAEHFPDALIKKCSESSCSLGLRNIPRRVLVKGEVIVALLSKKNASDKKACDCIVFVHMDSSLYCFLVELKNKDVAPRNVHEKFVNTVSALSQICQKCTIDFSFDNVFPLVLSKKLNPLVKMRLAKLPVHYKDFKYFISTKRCDCQLETLLPRLR